MSLNFDLTACKTRLGEARYNSITTSPWDSKKWHMITECLIWRTMAVGLGEISEKNIDEFCYRLRVLQIIDGPELVFNDGKIALTREDVENHIGLSTNVSNETRASWLKRVFSDKLYRMKLSTEGSAHKACNDLYDRQQAAEKKPDHALHDDDGELPEYDKL